MSAFNYARSQQTAERLIVRFGQVGKHRRGVTDTPIKLAVLEYTAREMDGTRVQVGDRRIYISPIGAPSDIKAGDKIIDAAGVPYVVVVASPLSPAGIVAYWDVQGRGPK